MNQNWQDLFRDDIKHQLEFFETRIVDSPDPWNAPGPLVYLTREMVQALLDGKGVYFWDGEYKHTLCMVDNPKVDI